MLLGLIKPTKGDAVLFGKSIRENPMEILRRVGSIVESPSYYGNLTAYENLEITRQILELDKHEIDRALEIVNLTKWKNKQVRTFSMGMKQRLALAQAILGERELLILDEPTNGLDPAGIHEIRELIKKLPEIMDVTVLVSSHILSEIELIVTKVGIISNGEMLFQGTLDELKDRSNIEVCVQARPLESAKKFLAVKGVQAEEREGKLYIKKKKDLNTAVISLQIYMGSITDNIILPLSVGTVGIATAIFFAQDQRIARFIPYAYEIFTLPLPGENNTVAVTGGLVGIALLLLGAYCFKKRNKIYAAKFFIGFLLTLINVLVFIMSVFAAGKLAGAPGAIPYDTIVVKPLMAFASSLFLRGCVFMAKILLCDDDRELRELLIKYLRSEGHDVSSAGDGLTSLKLALEDNFDLILLDVMMPFMDGFEVLRRLREKSAVPVILLTAKDEDVNKVLGLGIGADDYITKPFSLDEVGARVKALLRRVYYYAEAKREDDVLKSGELVMNLESCRVTLSGREIELTAKEYELLKFLMTNKGKVMTKNQIYRNVWRNEFVEDDNTVMVHISKLREKIEEDPKAPRRLKTIRGIGYRFEGE